MDQTTALPFQEFSFHQIEKRKGKERTEWKRKEKKSKAKKNEKKPGLETHSVWVDFTNAGD